MRAASYLLLAIILESGTKFGSRTCEIDSVAKRRADPILLLAYRLGRYI
jgi:hypothetical protein